MNLYEEAWKNIIRPIQITSKIHSYGPKERKINGYTIIRKDIEAINRHQKKISGFIFECLQFQTVETVLYLHGNGGSKIQALPLVQLIPKFRMNIAAFDMLGCGNSDSDNLSYGINEVFDMRDMLQEIRKHMKVTRVTLWGRSMGALCAIIFADMYCYEVNGLVLDSPFRSLSTVIDRIASRQVSLPSLVLKPFLYLVKKKVTNQLNYDIFSIDYLAIFKKLNINMPILFIFSNFDSIVPAREVLSFYNSYKGPKDLCQIYQTHDEDRPENLFKQGMMWITRTKKKNIQGMMQARQMLYTYRQKQKDKSELC